MSSAIEVLKDKLSDARYYTCMYNPEEEDEDILAFKEAIVALEQKEKVKEYVNELKADIEMLKAENKELKENLKACEDEVYILEGRG